MDNNETLGTARVLSLPQNEEMTSVSHEPIEVPRNVVNAIEKSHRIAVITHIAPDGDAIGSCLGLTHLLREQGKEVVPVCQDPVPYIVDWLPGVDEIVPRAPADVDLIISIDLSSVDRMGEAYDADALGHIPLVNIDHHVTNTYFGNVNWVEPRAVAACEMVYHLSQACGYFVSPMVATYLLTGLLTDTRGLRTANVNARVLRVATHLVELGAPIGQITEFTFNRKPLSVIKLWSLALQNLHIEPDGIIWVTITEAMRQKAGFSEQSDGGLVSFITAADTARVGVVFTEKPDGKVNVSMRARPGHDVARVAFALGGGGHPLAAGATINGPLEDATQRVIQMLRESLAERRAHVPLTPEARIRAE